MADRVEDWSAQEVSLENTGVTLVYNPEPEREGTRSDLARGLLYLLTFMIGGVIAFIGFGLLDATALTQSIFPSVVTLVGTALGFYFGTRQNIDNQRQEPRVDLRQNAGGGGANATQDGGNSKPPKVEITSPTEGASFKVSDTITISADAGASGEKTLAKVEFFDGDSLIGTSVSSPYSTEWVSTAVGTHSLKARATDQQGVSNESKVVTINVA